MPNLSYHQRAMLARRNIIVLIEYANGTAKCATASGQRIYTLEDLRNIATPPMQRLMNWIGGARA